MKPWQRWGALVLLVVVTVGIARAIVARKAEQALLMQTAQSTQNGSLQLAPGDLAVAQQARLLRTVEVSGSLRAVNSVVIKSRVSGELKHLSVREGDTVRKGQLIGQIDQTEYASRLEQARQQAASAKAQWQITQQTLLNNKALVAQGFISKNALDTSLSNAAAARATMQAAQAAADVARKAVSDTQLVSPIDGLVSVQYVKSGEKLSPDSRVIEVVDLRKLELQAALKPEDVAQIGIGTPGQLKVDGLPQPLDTRVARINPSADPATRAVTVYMSVSGHPALRQGLYARGQLDIAQQDAVVLPRSAVREGSSGAFVQVLRNGNVAHQQVSLGPEGRVDGSPGVPMVAVLQGLQGGEQVLRESVGLLREGTHISHEATARAAPAQAQSASASHALGQAEGARNR